MRLVELARRAAGKSPSYLARRALLEAQRRLGARRLRAKLAALDAANVASALGASSLSAFWQRRTALGFLLAPGEAARLRSLHETRLASEAAILRERAERILAHELDLLGSGPVRLGPEIDWHLDFKSGRRWPVEPSQSIDYAELGRPSDVKVPWEISRCQHLTALGRAWAIDGDPRWPREVAAQIDSWIAANPIGFGVNWACTMDVALRAASWIWTLDLLSHEGATALPAQTFERVLVSLYAHGLWIPEHLELGEVNGNHFLSDALGMVACGSLFAGSRDGDAWLEGGLRLLEREIQAQVDDDGVDIEASVPYHRLVLEIFLVGMRLAEAGGRSVSKAYRDRLRAMLAFVEAYVTPEGLSPVVGDADDGRALILGETEMRDHRYLLSTGAVLFGESGWASRAQTLYQDTLWFLGPDALDRFDRLLAAPADGATSSGGTDVSTRVFPDAGFFVLRSPGQYLFVDAGPVGFRGRGGHGHNDCLSFEWHALGRPLLTDSGAYVYTASVEWRNRFRSTASHNAIRIDGQEINRFPSELALWGLSDDAQPIDVRVESALHGATVSAGHTGYRRLADPVTVRRRFTLDGARHVLHVEDHLEARRAHAVEIFFHAAPGAAATPNDGTAVGFVWADGLRVSIAKTSGPELAWEEREGWFSPSYGVKTARPVWVAFGEIALPATFAWEITARSDSSPDPSSPAPSRR